MGGQNSPAWTLRARLELPQYFETHTHGSRLLKKGHKKLGQRCSRCRARPIYTLGVSQQMVEGKEGKGKKNLPTKVALEVERDAARKGNSWLFDEQSFANLY